MTQQIVARQIYRWCPIAVLLLVVGLAGIRLGSEKAQAEVRKTAPRAAFQSGSERSEQILREISQTLKSIDGRLQRLEKSGDLTAAVIRLSHETTSTFGQQMPR